MQIDISKHPRLEKADCLADLELKKYSHSVGTADHYIGINLEENMAIEVVRKSVPHKTTPKEAPVMRFSAYFSVFKLGPKVPVYNLQIVVPNLNPIYATALSDNMVAFDYNSSLYFCQASAGKETILSHADLEKCTKYDSTGVVKYGSVGDTVYYITSKDGTVTLNQASKSALKSYNLPFVPANFSCFKLSSGKQASISILESSIFCTVDGAGKSNNIEGQAASYDRHTHTLYILQAHDGKASVTAYTVGDDADIVVKAEAVASVQLPAGSAGDYRKARIAHLVGQDGDNAQPTFIVIFGNNQICKLGDTNCTVLASPEIFGVADLRTSADGKIARCIIRNFKGKPALLNKILITVVNIFERLN